MDKDNRHITLAYFEQRSTVDYIGAVQGIPVCFDAKECSADTFPLANVHEHQVQFMKDFEAQGGVAFFLIFYSKTNEFYYLRLCDLLVFWERREEGGRKSFRREELNPDYYLEKKTAFWCHISMEFRKTWKTEVDNDRIIKYNPVNYYISTLAK